MNLPTQAQVNAALRYAGTSAATVGTVVTLVGLLPGDTAHNIVEASQKLFTDLQAVVGDLYLLAGLIGPVIAVWLAKRGVTSASPKAQVAAVQALPTAQVIVTDPAIAAPGVQVVDKLPPPAAPPAHA